AIRRKGAPPHWPQRPPKRREQTAFHAGAYHGDVKPLHLRRRSVIAPSSACFVNHHALQRIDVALPRLLQNHAPGVTITRLPARSNTCIAEVYVLCVILAPEARGEEPNEMHRRAAAEGCEFVYRRIVALTVRQPLRKLTNHVTQSLELLLASDVTQSSA